ncbi:hypothetical protein AVEN_126029-1 [Araneus ventricosus]|uniref:Uncharacterized protein n=1 Tax=Araneus ventricosus TaxID=182803 RepID=A0A4Y2RCP5_ARAVE|nr:hypothetical protein AVEN_126029-1 [Araneus ventricosus]
MTSLRFYIWPPSPHSQSWKRQPAFCYPGTTPKGSGFNSWHFDTPSCPTQHSQRHFRQSRKIHGFHRQQVAKAPSILQGAILSRSRTRK